MPFVHSASAMWGPPGSHLYTPRAKEAPREETGEEFCRYQDKGLSSPQLISHCPVLSAFRAFSPLITTTTR